MRKPEHIVLVACSAKKTQGAPEAQYLYNSVLFKAAQQYAKTYGDRWFILSAFWGLLTPSSYLSPYNRTLNDMPRNERERWARDVCGSLRYYLPPRCRVTILAGRKYYEFLKPKLEHHGYTVELPLAHMGIGQQVQWLKAQVRAAA